MKIGDKVSFLSEIGGGRVAGFQGRDIVLVEDEDGFQIPMPVSDVVVTSTGNDYSISKVVGAAKKTSETACKSDGMSIKARLSMQDADEDTADEDEWEPADREITFRPKVEERRGGNMLSCYIAFVPVDIKELTDTRFETYFVNDSNYYVRYACYSAEGATWNLLYEGEAEPNTKAWLNEFGRDSLNELSRMCVQLIAFKRDKGFVLKPAVDVQFRIDGVKFYKLHTFEENSFFEQPALLYTIIENDKVPASLVIDPKKLKQEMYRKPEQKPAEADSTDGDDGYVRRYDDGRAHHTVAKRDKDTEVVDLHADALLDTTAGMSSADILNYQLDIFRRTIEKFKTKKGKRIIFIHGKGEGVLRHAIIHELNYRYKGYSYQDASFQEYGYGATQVTIK